MALSNAELKELARYGAHVRLKELQRQIAAIRAAFPSLGRSGGKMPSTTERRWHMSTAARKAASERMKKYWAARRKAKQIGAK